MEPVSLLLLGVLGFVLSVYPVLEGGGCQAVEALQACEAAAERVSPY